MADIRLKGFVTLSTCSGRPLLIAIELIESLYQADDRDGIKVTDISMKNGAEYSVQGSISSVVEKIANARV